MKFWLVTMAATLAALGLHGAASAQGGPPPALVSLDEARMETLEAWREVTGKLRPARNSRLASEVEGRVIELFKREGAQVQAGETIAHLEDTRARLALDRAQARVGVAEATLRAATADRDNAERDLERVRRLLAAGGGNEAELDTFETRLQRAEASVAEAKAQLDAEKAEQALAEKELADHTIVAPFDGWVVALATEVGQWVDRGGDVAEIISSGPLEAWLEVPEQIISRVRQPGVQLRIRIPPLGMTVSSMDVRIVPRAEASARLFPTVVTIDDADGQIRPGMSIVGLAPTGFDEPVLTVPKDAIQRDTAGEFVFFNAGGTAAAARVRSLFAVGERVAIRSESLPPGAMVVVEGNERLFPGQPLRTAGADADGLGSEGG
ncbi:MAG: efflux RND transporter periplasmic adaptor subunit [Phycisphaerales bacterium JB039]